MYNVFARFLQNSVDRDVMRGAHGILGREWFKRIVETLIQL